jgi:hypothetical protein
MAAKLAEKRGYSIQKDGDLYHQAPRTMRILLNSLDQSLDADQQHPEACPFPSQLTQPDIKAAG